jgi:hypothetical protein
MNARSEAACRTAAGRRWREGKVRPLQGNSPHDRPVSRGILSPRRICDDPFSATGSVDATNYTEAPQYAFLRHGGIFLVRCSFKGKTKPWGEADTASRRSAPSPGKRTRREDHALSHRPQMSSGRLFLDRVARQHCPSPLHRHTQINMHSPHAIGKRDISTLLRWGHFYFALTYESRNFACQLDPANDSVG